MKILLIEDDEPTALALKEALSAYYYTVTIASDGQTGLELAQAFTYDLLLLDVIIPNMDGVTLCRHLRYQGYQSPILLLTALDNSTQRVVGLDAGADDYLVKPFEIEELEARMRALLRRGNSTLPPVIRWGELQFDPSRSEFIYGGIPLRLTAKEYSLLELFLLNPRRVYSRSAILDHVWAEQEYPTDNTVTAHIKSLRHKLKAAGATTDFIETLYGLGYRLNPLVEQQTPDEQTLSIPEKAGETVEKKERLQQQVTHSVGKLWEKFKDSFSAQIEVLEQASMALSQDKLTPQLHQKAQQEAHKLAGSLGIFGCPEGSTLAKRLEQLLETEETLEPEQALQMLQLLGLLKQAIAQKPLNPPAAKSPTPTPLALPTVSSSTMRLLVIDDDRVLTEQIKSQATVWRMQVDVASDLNTARQAIAQTPPDIILLDLIFPESRENGLALMAELALRNPEIPIIIFTGRDDFRDRLEVARLGGCAFLHKPVSLEQILETITQVHQQTQAKVAKVMVVDDDPILLETVHHWLQPQGMTVTTLKNSQRFWEVFAANPPDLLILDLEMPEVSGIDLCKVVRNEPHWSNLPILFLTAHTEKDTINQMLKAGADDCLTKPIFEQEFVTRIVSKLERARGRKSPS